MKPSIISSPEQAHDLQKDNSGKPSGNPKKPAVRPNRGREGGVRTHRQEARTPLSLSISPNSIEEESKKWFRSSKLVKSALALELNCRAFIEEIGLERIGFMTWTFRENLCDVIEAQRRFNSLRTNYLRPVFGEFVTTKENQDRGALHYHLLVDCGCDIRSGFDFDKVALGDYRSAAPELRAIWKDMRSCKQRFGFGRSELLPIRETGVAVGRYVSKYISKWDSRMQGVRRLTYSKGFPRVATPEFSWVDGPGGEYRKHVREFAKKSGVKTFSEMRIRFGNQWAFNLANEVLTQNYFDQQDRQSERQPVRGEGENGPVPSSSEPELATGVGPIEQGVS